ncbi:flagellar export chaperone FliS [Dactylosporangium aurantiacum]|uniref:Flagellar export chaperone FliS n=1 Tax=Dactylosporangium aurantiacum TaxID=35754 RepID=A0A9Q9ICQ0_9ACTN|nr:flagellar export chaperone FliS [Dactylosporangium aurantiacum]MDG6102037.1 flagellar export chaperone FliS [Dactylosporangium aurantiacum]UWZ53627.1 flagellar export chaperone FliS [Dactylosporangium aurantiacum]
MTTQALRNRYVSDSVATAPPSRLLVMLYDRLVLDLMIAGQSLEQGDRLTASGRIQHAQEIIMELRATLDTSAWSGGPGLAALYSFLITELVQANVTGDRAKVESVQSFAEQLRDAWREAAAQVIGAGP